MLGTFAAAFGLGLVFNAAPGPVFAATLRYGVRGGFRPALLVQLGSLAGDAAWAALGLGGVGLLAQSDALRAPIGVIGALYLSWLGWDAWRASRQQLADEPAVAAGRTGTGNTLEPVRTGVLLSLTNPQNVGYWAALGTALGAVGVAAPAAADYAVFFAGFMTSSLVWSLVFAAIVDRVLGRASIGWTRMTYRLCAIVFLALALASLRQLWLGRGRPLDPAQAATPVTMTCHG
jgi:chemosensory pili system protein ChpE/L-lysine exporter family protein LysE/ArgO